MKPKPIENIMAQVKKAHALGPVYQTFRKLWEGTPITLSGVSADPAVPTPGFRRHA